jgi:cytochrome c553
LAGLPVEYVAKQLFDYREGTRPNAIMAPIAKALTDADIASLAQYYVAERAIDQARGNSACAGLPARPLWGQQPALPACMDCHGNNATAQLQAFRSERGNDGTG